RVLFRSLRHGEAYQAAAVFGHEVDRIGRCKLCGDYQIPLVFAIFRIDEDEHLAVAGVLDDFLCRGKVFLIAHFLLLTSAMRATYRASTSISRLIRRPTVKPPKVVWDCVCGMILTVK